MPRRPSSSAARPAPDGLVAARCRGAVGATGAQATLWAAVDRCTRSGVDGYRSAEAIRDSRRCEHDRVRIDRRAALGLAASRFGQRRTRGVQTGEARPPAEAAAGLQRRGAQQPPGAHEVNPDLPPPALGPSLLKNGPPRRGHTAGMAHVHQHVRRQRLSLIFNLPVLRRGLLGLVVRRVARHDTATA